MEKIIIGRKDHADLPLFGLKNVPVKVDSGAYSSSIHCDHINLVESDGEQYLKVEFFGTEEKESPIVIFEDFITKIVRSSSGQEETRYFVQGDIILFGKKYKTRFSLSERLNMRYPILLGRKLLNKRFVIDSSKIDLSAKNVKTTIFIK